MHDDVFETVSDDDQHGIKLLLDGMLQFLLDQYFRGLDKEEYRILFEYAGKDGAEREDMRRRSRRIIWTMDLLDEIEDEYTGDGEE